MAVFYFRGLTLRPPGYIQYYLHIISGFTWGYGRIVGEMAKLGHTVSPTTVRSSEGVEIVKTPFQSPNCNAYAERFVREARETLDNFILIGQSHLERVVKQIAEHHNTCRPHQGIENNIPLGYQYPDTPAPPSKIKCKAFLGGLLNHYYVDKAA